MKIQIPTSKRQRNTKFQTPKGAPWADAWGLDVLWSLVFGIRCFNSKKRSPPLFARRRDSGVSLIECLVYIAVLVVVLGTATVGFNRCWDDSKRLRRNADDIVRSLHAGEQWRADLRAATGDIRVVNQDGREKMIIPVHRGQIIYDFSNGELQRQAGHNARAVAVLDHVKSSQMQAEQRQKVAAWRWELELLPVQKNVRLRPLFTFETVAGHTLTR